MQKYRLLAGKHIEEGPPDPKTGAPTEVVYRPGNVFESPLNLMEMFNAPGSMKFEPVHPTTPVEGGRLVVKRVLPHRDQAAPQVQPTAPLPPRSAVAELPSPDDIDRMGLKDLQALASEEGIDLKNAKSLEETRRVIKAALRNS